MMTFVAIIIPIVFFSPHYYACPFPIVETQAAAPPPCRIASYWFLSHLPTGACLPLLVTLLSWRLALLIPARKLGVTSTITSKSQETQNLQYFSSTPAGIAGPPTQKPCTLFNILSLHGLKNQASSLN